MVGGTGGVVDERHGRHGERGDVVGLYSGKGQGGGVGEKGEKA